MRVLAQAPVITYASPNIYRIGAAISPLSALNTGGPIPANIYNMVATFAGDGSSRSFDGIATSSGFNRPSGIATDALGNVYVSDFVSGAIRKITLDATVSTIGNVQTPSGLIVDNLGNVFISNFDECRIYKITPAGIKTVFAGAGYSGTSDGLGTAANFYGPGGMAIDQFNNLYVADQANNKIRKVSAIGLVTTIAGSGVIGATDGAALSASFNNPDGVAVDAQGNLYIGDSKNNKIRKISVSGIVTTLAGSGLQGRQDGLGTAASFNYPTSIGVDVAANLYISDYKNNLIRKVSPTGLVSTLTGSGSAGSLNGIGSAASFNGPLGLAFDPFDNLYVSDYISNLIRKVTLTGYVIDKQLPAGLSFDAKTGVITGVPTAVSPVSDYIITAYNVYGSSSAIVSLEVIGSSPVNFSALTIKTVCDQDFDPGAVSNTPVTYTSSNPLVATIVSGKIHIVAAGETIITASNGFLSADQVLTIKPLPIPTIRITPVSYWSCIGLELKYEAITNNAGSNPTYQWRVNGQVMGINGPKFVSSDLSTGDVITCVVTNNDNCIAVSSLLSNSASLIAAPYTSLSVNITSLESKPLCSGTMLTFTANPSGNMLIEPDYLWYVNGQSTGFDSHTLKLATLKDGDLVFCMMSSGGACIINPIVKSNVILIHVLSGCEIKIPNAFSPNGDNLNDKWIINTLSGYPECSVKVYNRYGAIVFQSKGYTEPWDGTRKGQALPLGTYYYLIDIPGNNRQRFSGSVSILH